MPTYEYTCKSCRENIEVFQSFNAKPLKKHDVCGGELQKVFHSRGVVFKGSGWYAKDSKNGGSGSGEPAKKTSDKKESTKLKTESTKATSSSTDSSD